MVDTRVEQSAKNYTAQHGARIVCDAHYNYSSTMYGVNSV